MPQAAPLPDLVNRWLGDFVQSAKTAFGNDLLSVTLFGSAAEGKLRPSSDVNLILVLKRFDQAAADAISEPLRAAHAAILLEAMFILESEIALAAESFAVKFADIETRHEVLFGKDYFTSLEIPVEALKFRVTQVLANQILRLRESYVLNSPQDEQLSRIIAGVAGPLRAAAVTLLKLQGRSASDPKEALQLVARDHPGTQWDPVLLAVTKAREGALLASDEARNVYFSILALANLMLADAETLSASR
jgi:predicted nucleotidyltransferase